MIYLVAWLHEGSPGYLIKFSFVHTHTHTFVPTEPLPFPFWNPPTTLVYFGMKKKIAVSTWVCVTIFLDDFSLGGRGWIGAGWVSGAALLPFCGFDSSKADPTIGHGKGKVYKTILFRWQETLAWTFAWTIKMNTFRLRWLIAWRKCTLCIIYVYCSCEGLQEKEWKCKLIKKRLFPTFDRFYSFMLIDHNLFLVNDLCVCVCVVLAILLFNL